MADNSKHRRARGMGFTLVRENCDLAKATSKPLSGEWRYRKEIPLPQEQDILFPR